MGGQKQKASARQKTARRNVLCLIHKLTYGDGRAYRYLVSDSDRQLYCVAKRSGLLLPAQPRLVEFFDTNNKKIGHLHPSETASWNRTKKYQIYDEQEPYACIYERWKLVDVLLLRLPRYEIRIGSTCYIAEGSRYGTGHFYGVFVPRDGQESLEETEAKPIRELDAIFEEIGKARDALEKTPAREAMAKTDESLNDLEEDIVVDSKAYERELEERQTDKKLVGVIECPTSGPSYIVETGVKLLRRTPLVLASLAMVIDMEQFS
jgi:hypothetical protein